VHLLPLTEWLTPSLPTFAFFHVRDRVALSYLIPIFGAHCVLSPKTTLMMLPRRTSQCLHPDEDSSQTSDQNKTHHPSTKALPTIAKGVEPLTFDTIPQVQPQPANMPTTAAGSSQNELPVPPKPMEVLHTKHRRGHHCQFRSFTMTQSLIKSKCKTGIRKPRKSKLQQKRRN
jgi:hypothetical protein